MKAIKFEELNCWQKSRELVNLIYDISESGKLKRDFSTRDQIIRAALSTMNNIAEGFGRHSDKEFIRFLDFSVSSGMEVRSMLYVLHDRNYIDELIFNTAYKIAIEHSNLTYGLIRYLTKKIN